MSDVRRLAIKKLSPIGLWIASALLIIIGGGITASMIFLLLRGDKATIGGVPPAMVVGGIVLPFLARKRYGVSVEMVNGTFLWKPPLLIDKRSKRALTEFLNRFAAAASLTSAPFTDERPAPNPLDTADDAVPRQHNYPMGKMASDEDHGAKTCYHCRRKLKLDAWEQWNGFLVQCPHCFQLHGHSWNAFAVLFVSLILNGFSFFFTMRWKKALILCSIFIAAYGSMFKLTEQVSDNLQLLVMGIVMGGPVMINAVLLILHERDLKSADVFSSNATL
jgi:hypothetical protein